MIQVKEEFYPNKLKSIYKNSAIDVILNGKNLKIFNDYKEDEDINWQLLLNIVWEVLIRAIIHGKKERKKER